ncbi:MAG: AAA family ATPase [Ilumatobacteraceae bacterium]
MDDRPTDDPARPVDDGRHGRIGSDAGRSRSHCCRHRAVGARRRPGRGRQDDHAPLPPTTSPPTTDRWSGTPTAKAARVLEAGTGIDCDTVAKLVYEHTRPDRPPRPDWDLAPGTTVVIDEAGMLATHDLYRLTRLADEHHWRLALVGDPHQLQAVGRGGMFAELCATGRTIELDQIHRFDNEWEAAASLTLRHGDPTGLQPYLDHQRIQPAPIRRTLRQHRQLLDGCP